MLNVANARPVPAGVKIEPFTRVGAPKPVTAPKFVPRFPVMVEVPALPTAPEDENKAKLYNSPKLIGEVPEGVLIVFGPTVIAPLLVNNLPSSVLPDPRLAAALNAKRVPFIAVDAAIVIAPADVATQNTFLACAPLIKLTVVPAAVVNAP